nr:sigma-E processing peptidase SpoIIGA [uncultured Anaerostipes sp.]
MIIIFLRQCLALGFLLALIGTAFKQKCRIRRILSASAVGSAVGCAALFLPGKIFCFLLAFWLTVKIAFGGNRKRQLYLSGCLAAAAVFYGGVWTAMVGWLPFSSWLLGCLSAAAGIWLLYRLVWRDIKRQKDFLYQVEFSWAGKTIHVCGFADTGNFLYEPIGRMPVSVIDKSALQKYYKGSLKDLIEKHDENGIRMIPYHSVGRKRGVMTGIIVRNLLISGKEGKIQIEKGVIGISEEPLSEKGAYQLLLHPDLIQYGRL